MKHDKKRCYKNTRFYFSTCSDEDKKFYYCHGFSNIILETRNCFLEHQHYISRRYVLLLCLSPFHPLIYLLNLFCACFLPVPTITPFIVFVDCLNACGNSPARQLICNGNIHAYERQLKKSMIGFKEKTPLLTKSVHSYKIYKYFFLHRNACCCCSIFTFIVNFSLII